MGKNFYFLKESIGVRSLWNKRAVYANKLVTCTTSSSGILCSTCAADIDSRGVLKLSLNRQRIKSYAALLKSCGSVAHITAVWDERKNQDYRDPPGSEQLQD